MITKDEVSDVECGIYFQVTYVFTDLGYLYKYNEYIMTQ